MSMYQEAIKEHADACEKKLPKIYVSWIWLAGILVSLVGAAGVVGWKAAERLSAVEREIDRQSVILQTVRSIDDKLDKLAGLRHEIEGKK